MDMKEICETWLRLDFFLAEPASAIATRRNLVFQLDEITFPCLLRAVNENCGIWGEHLPPYTPTGPEEWQGEWPLVESFWRWGDPSYQRELMSYAGFGSWTVFQMLIPANTSIDVLRRLRDESSDYGSAKSLSWDDDLYKVATWVEDLRWACVPLIWGEMRDAVFVGGSACDGLVSRVIGALRETGRARAEILPGVDGKAVWHPLSSL